MGIRHTIAHDLPLAEVRAILERAFEGYRRTLAKHDPQMRWLDERRMAVSFRAAGSTLDGTLTIEPRTVEVELEVPLHLRLFRGRAIRVIEEEVDTLLREKRG